MFDELFEYGFSTNPLTNDRAVMSLPSIYMSTG